MSRELQPAGVAVDVAVVACLHVLWKRGRRCVQAHLSLHFLLGCIYRSSSRSHIQMAKDSRTAKSP